MAGLGYGVMRGPRAVPDARRGHAEAWGRLSRRSSAAAATPTWACRSPRAGTRRRACQDPKPSNQAQGGVPLTETRRNALLKLSFSTAILSTSLDFFAFNAFAQSLGILETRKAELKEVDAALAQSPKDEVALLEKGYLDGQIKSIEANMKFLDQKRPLVESGKENFLQHAVLEVSDVDKAVRFWTEGLGMKVNRSRNTDGVKQAFVSYGPETLTADNGGMFALELIENKESKQDNSGQYFQFALSNSLRVNRLYNAGGEITFGYGYFEINAPDGYKVVVYIDNRRDPFDLIGVYVDDVEAAVSYYQKSFDMQPDRAYASQKVGRFDPERPKGSVLMTYGDPKDNTSILLIPRQGQKPSPAKQSVKIAVLDKDVYERQEKLKSVGVEPAFVGPVPGIGTKVALVLPNDGVPIVFVDYKDFEKEQPTPTVLSIKEEIQAYVAMAKLDEEN